MKKFLIKLVMRARAFVAKLKALLLTPVCMIRLRGQRDSQSSVEEAINFCFNSCMGIIQPMQVREELRLLLEEVQGRQPRTMLEIGTARGGTLFCFARMLPETATLISIDLPGGQFGGGYPGWKRPLYRMFPGPRQTLHLIRANSHNQSTLNCVEELLDGESLDLLFIDGDHTYQGVKKDFDMYSPLVEDDGMIVLHDIVPHAPQSGCEVNRLWEELEDRYRTRRLVKDWEQGWAGIGLIKP